MTNLTGIGQIALEVTRQPVWERGFEKNAFDFEKPMIEAQQIVHDENLTKAKKCITEDPQCAKIIHEDLYL